MGLSCQKVGKEDLDLLADTRIRVLRAVDRLDDDMGIPWAHREFYEYYVKSLGDRTHCTYPVFDKNRLVRAGGMSFHRVMLTYHSPTGWKAYIMNVYTHLEYRRRRIVLRVLDLLVKGTRQAGIGFTSLEAAEMGRPLYKKYGSVRMNNKMALPS